MIIGYQELSEKVMKKNTSLTDYLMEEVQYENVLQRDEVANDCLYFKIVLMVKIWSADKIKKCDLELMNPFHFYVIKTFLEKRFKRQFELDMSKFQKQIISLHKFKIPKRTDYYLSFLFTQFLCYYQKFFDLSLDEIHDHFYHRYFKSDKYSKKFSTFFSKCKKKGI